MILDNLNLILLLIAILSWLSGFYFLYKIPKCQNYNNIVYPSISIIIPARNEEINIGKLLDSINSQHFDSGNLFEVIVVNDASIDRTREIALEKGAKVIDNISLPEGWLGKPWACYNGAINSIGDLLFFVDSDTFIETGGLKKIIDTFLNHSMGTNENIVMSIAPYHKIINIYEELSALFNLVMHASMNAFTPNINAKPIGLFGQSLLIKRENYYKIGGHESVKDKILENMLMAEKFKDIGMELICFGGKDAFSFRMYPSGLRDLINGWKKAFASGATQIPFITLLNIIFWISGGFVITIVLINGLLINQHHYFWIILYIFYSLQIMWMLNKIGSFRIISSLLFPIHFIFFCLLFTNSFFNKIFKIKTNWKSREVQ